jgi:hypothetical protein
MAYISFRGVRVGQANAKWAFRASIAGLVLLIVALVADRIVRSPDVALYSFFGAQALLMATFVIAVPGIVIPLGLLLAPFGVAVFGVTHDREVWTTWWFWGFTAVCEVAGGFALVWFGAKYDKREL